MQCSKQYLDFVSTLLLLQRYLGQAPLQPCPRIPIYLAWPIGELPAEMRTRFAEPLSATPQLLDSRGLLSHWL